MSSLWAWYQHSIGIHRSPVGHAHAAVQIKRTDLQPNLHGTPKTASHLQPATDMGPLLLLVLLPPEHNAIETQTRKLQHKPLHIKKLGTALIFTYKHLVVV
jgi:hypothetical protein